MTATRIAAAAVVALALSGCGSTGAPSASTLAPKPPSTPASTPTTSRPSTSEAPVSTPAATFTITSSAFTDGAPIPSRFTCDGENVSPALTWTGVPAGAAALALVVDDPDAPNGTFTHWVVVDINPSTTGSAEGQPPPGGREITNDTGKASYFGPCPPSGTHHYRFTLYALRSRIGSGPTSKQAALDAIRAAATAQARVVGTFHR